MLLYYFCQAPAVVYVLLLLCAGPVAHATFLDFIVLQESNGTSAATADDNSVQPSADGNVTRSWSGGYGGNNGQFCVCKPASHCQQSNGIPPIDIRIVTPPVGVQCGQGAVYCCYTGQQCGLSTQVPVADMTLAPGQASFGQYPWEVLVVNLHNDFIGSGALIDNQHVLTAAHRVYQHDRTHLVARIGDWDVQRQIEPLPHIDIRVSSLLLHPYFNLNTLQYDVAILTLERPVSLNYATTPNINNICLPDTSSVFTNSKCWVSGWGKNMFGPTGSYQNIQKQVDVDILSYDNCDNLLRKTRLGPHFKLDEQSFFCAGGENGKDACTGDGGSPLVCQGEDGRWQLVGLVAWGIGCAQPGVPGVYVNIPAMIPWIQQSIQPLPFNQR